MNDKQLEYMMQYENLVYKAIGKYQGYFDKDDLYQVGMLGLREAIMHMDPTRMDTFTSYAKLYIKGHINQFLRENKSIKQSKDVISLQRKYDLAKERMTQQIGRNPTLEEMAFILEEDVSKIKEIEQSRIQTFSLDYQQEEEANLYNYIRQDEMAYQAEFLDLHQAIQELPSPDKEIIIAQFFEGKTQSEIAKHLGISQVQVHRKKEHGLQLIKQKVA